MSAALAAAMLVSAVAVPVFAEGSNTMQYYYDKTDVAYKTQTNTDPAQNSDTTDTTRTTQGQTVVKYEVHESYIWSIPSEINFGSDQGAGKHIYVNPDPDRLTPGDPEAIGKEDTASVIKVDKNVIPSGTKLVVTAEGSGDPDDNGKRMFTMANAQGDELSYAIDASGTRLGIGSGTYEVLSLEAGENTKSVDLTFSMVTTGGHRNGAEFAGEYKGTVTFTATVENK